MLILLVPTQANAAQWPDLLKPAPSVGGGEKDAAVIMSVENYTFVAPIPGARANANAWRDYLNKTRGIPDGKIFLNIDRDVTLEKMKLAAAKVALIVGDGGTLWYIFIGHGAASMDGKQGLLVGMDTEPEAISVNSRSLPQDILISTLLTSKASSIIVLMDSCFSGRSGDGSPLIKGIQPLGIMASGIPQDPRLMTFMAAGGKEFAGQLPGEERPAFSYLTLGGLRGWADADKNGVVTAEELRNYTEGIMRTMVKDRTQTPQLQGDGSHAMVKSPGESGPDLAELAKELAGRKATPFEFKVSALPAVPRAIMPSMSALESLPSVHLPGDMDKAEGIDFGTVDVDELGKYDEVVKFDKSDAAPEEKSARWRELGLKSKTYAATAAKRAEQWDEYAAQAAYSGVLKNDESSDTPRQKAAKWRELTGKYPQFKGTAEKRLQDWERYARELDAAEEATKKRAGIMADDWAKLGKLLSYTVVSEEAKQKFAVTFVKAYGKIFKGNPYIHKLAPFLPPGFLTAAEIAEAVRAEEIDKAIANETRAIELYPTEATYYNSRGVSYHKKGEYDKADTDFTKAIELNPGEATYYLNRGNTYFYKKGEYDKGNTDFTKAIELKPSHAAYNARGLTYHWKGEYVKAITDYTKAIELNQAEATYYLNRGHAYNEKRSYDEAITDYTRAIELKPGEETYHNARGVSYYEKGEYGKAVTDFTKAIELNPGDANYYNNRGDAYNNKKSYDKAIRDYTKAIELNPTGATFYNYRKEAYIKAGKDVEAKEYLLRSKELNKK